MNIVRNLFKRLAARDAREPRPTATPAPLLMALEPRIVYDASVAAIGAAQHHAEASPHAAGARPAMERAHEIAVAADADGAPRSLAWARSFTQPHRDNGAPAAGSQVVFIDPSVAHYQQLVAGLPSGTRYVVLNSATDGLAQIAQYLQQHPGVASIHLVSHGAEGEIQIGSTWLNQVDLAAHSATLAQIGAAMKPGGDFLIYGCDVAQRADGQVLVQQIAAISHLNVAASTDATGAAALGGDWTLEYTAGAVHTPVIFSRAAQQQYNGLLYVQVETYDSQVGFDTGGTPVPSTAFDGLLYTGDQSVEWSVVSGSLGSNPSGGSLVVNVQGTQMSSMTIQRQDGALMAVQSFDIDVFVSDQVTVQAVDASGTVLGNVVLNVASNGNSSLFHVDLSGNTAFSQVKSLRIMESGVNGAFLSPTLDNFAYIAPSSPPTLTATGGSTAFVAGDNTASIPVTVDAGITLTDGNASTATSAAVSIAGNLHNNEDVLGFTNTSTATYGNIASSYNTVTGVLTMTSAGGTASIAQWQAAFRAVTYTDTAVTPNTATRTISFQVISDGFTGGNATIKTVTVAATDQTPVVSTAHVTRSYVGGSSPLTVDGSVSVSDRDNTTQSSGTVSIGAGFQSGDTLAFNNSNATIYGNVAASYNAATGVLTLTSAGATATDAQWANALSAVTFSTTSTVTGNRTIAFATSDGAKTSVAATDTVNVLSPLQLTTDSGSAAFVAGDNTASTPVVIDAGLTVTDTAATALGSATVAITGNYINGEDFLGFVNDGATMGNITGSYQMATGVLTLTSAGGTATLAQWQAALRSVTYTDTIVTPDPSLRTISFTATDSAGNVSNTATRNVTVTDTDQSPIVTTTGGTVSYVAGNSGVIVDGGVHVSDLDNATAASATAAITSGFQSGDVLSFTNTSATLFGNIQASYSNNVLLLSSIGYSATVQQWSNALSAVRFSSGPGATPGDRTVSFQVNDSVKNSAQVTATVSVSAPPKITTDAGSAAFVAGDNTASTPVAIDSGLTVTDGSSATLASATVAITGNFHAGEDVLTFANTDGAAFGNITGAYNASTGQLTLTSAGASASLAQWQAALQAVTYTDTAITPNSATRTISFSAVDTGAYTSNTATRTVTVTAVDQTPIVVTSHGTTGYLGGHPAVTVDAGIMVTDLDNTTQSFATAAITAGFHSGDTLTFVNTSAVTFGNIVGSYNAATGVLTLTSSGATATNAQWAQALSAVTFSAGSSAAFGPRTVAFAVSDGTRTSAAASDTVDVLSPPTIATDAGSAAFVAGDNAASTPVAIDAGLTVTDGASTTLASATVAITGNFHSGEDVLGFVNDGATMGNIGASYDAATGVLTLTSTGATATLAQWQAALEAVTYTDTAVTPNTATRTVSFGVVDGAGIASNTATRTVTVAATDQTPIVTASGGSTAFVAGDNTASTPVVIDPGMALSDRDNATLAAATVSISGQFRAGEDVLAFANDGATMGNIAASYDAATGVLTLTSAGATATVAQWQAALRSVTYVDTAISPDAAARTISIQVSDGAKTSAAATRTVTVTDTDQTPIVSASGGSAAFVAADNAASAPVAIDPGVVLSDRDNATLASATVSISGQFHPGEDVLGFVNDGATMGNIGASYDASTGVLRLSSTGGTATLAQWQAALRSVTYTDTAVTPNAATRTISFSVSDGAKTSVAATRTVTVADTDQTPVVTVSGGSTAFVAGDNAASTPVAVDAGLSLADRDNATLASATVAISANYHPGQDLLGFVNDGTSMGNITASYDAATGVMTMSSAGATASVAQWQAALRAVTYTDTAVTPDTATRTISIRVSDGTKASATATRAVTVAATDQTPVVVTTGGAGHFGGPGITTPVAVDPGIRVADRDNATLAGATVAIVGGFRAGDDQLHFVNDGASMGNIAASYDAATGVLTLTSAGATATLAQWQAALAAVTYAETGVAAPAGERTIAFVVNDGTRNSVAATRDIAVAAGFAGQAGQFVGASALPVASGDVHPGGQWLAGEPVVLNALAAPALPASAASMPTTVTFTAPGGEHARTYQANGGTRVDARLPTVPVPIPAPFNVPVATEHLGAAAGANFAVALAPMAGVDERIVAVTQADGRPLPAWASFDAASGTLRGHAPTQVKTHALRLRVAMVDQQGHLTYREVVIDFGKEGHGHARPASVHPAVPQAAGKPSLSEQFARERRALHVAGAAGPGSSAPAGHH